MTDSDVYAAAEIQTEFEYDPSDDIKPWAGVVDDPQTVRLLNHLDNTLPMPVEESAIGEEILGNAATKMLDEAVRAGNVSQEKRITGMTNNHGDEEKLLYGAAERLSNEGTIGLMWGSPGSGKTALSLDISRVWSALTGGSVIGNTRWDGYDQVVMSDEEMLEAMASIRGPVLAVIDETAQDLSGFGSDMKPAEEFSNALTMVRKREGAHGPYAKRGSVFMVSHTKTKVAKAFRDLAMFAVEKPTNQDPGRAILLSSQSDSDNFEVEYPVSGLSDTNEQYDEHEASEFVIHGIDDEDTEANEEESDDTVDREEIVRDHQIKMAVEAYAADPDASYREIAESPGIKYAKDWVGDRIREYNDGEHRYLWDGDSPDIDE